MGIELEMGRPQEEGWVRGAILGAGAYGTVSLAVSRSNGQLFAIKSAAGFSVALENEYQILRCLDCPYIVRCLGHNYSFENGAEVHNLFLEYMPGGSLVDLLGKFGGTLNETVIRAYTRGIVRGLDYLHSQGIVHCDIKGKNILVDSNGVKLADFGSAKRVDHEEKCEEAPQLRGTPQWMAPEVVNQLEPMLPETRNGKQDEKRQRYEKRSLKVSHARNEEREKQQKYEKYRFNFNFQYSLN